ncbi:MAG TPA: hypothetical protein VKP67_28655 [Xanthobacteraceae bacterium]|nr:hypothetical protein [Xanthobacteraceae bacterium]
MTILSAMFGSDPAAEICVGSLVFLLIYLAGFALFQNWSRISRPTPVIHRHIISGLSAALVALSVVFWLHATNTAAASAKEQSGAVIAPLELHRFIDMNALPVHTFEDQSLIYPRQ